MTHFLITPSLTTVVALVSWWVWGRGLWWWVVGGVGFDECGCDWIVSWVMALPVMGFANHALVPFKKSLTIPRRIDYANDRHNILSTGQLQILPITYSFLLPVPVFYPPLLHSILYFLQHNFFPICKQSLKAKHSKGALRRNRELEREVWGLPALSSQHPPSVSIPPP